MKEIDFRPHWYSVLRKRKRDAVIRYSLLCFLTIELGFCFLGVSFRNAEAQQQLTELRGAIENQAAIFEDFGGLVVDLGELQSKRALLSDVGGGVPVHAILAELSGMMPGPVAITSIDYRHHRGVGGPNLIDGVRSTATDAMRVDKPNELEVRGVAASDQDIGGLMSRMATSALFTNVALIYSQPTIRGRALAREFELTFTVPQFE